MFFRYGLTIPDILLPGGHVDYAKWAVVACDQYTAQPEYWEAVRDYVGGMPSTLDMIYPEAWLNRDDKRIEGICAAMRLLEKTALNRDVHGFMLVERQVARGARLGLLAALDLERYDPAPGSRSLIRGTEGTIADRVPPRVRVRRNAPLELPHIMALADDPGRALIEPVYGACRHNEPLYDFELMFSGGRARGWRVPDDMHGAMASALDGLLGASGGLLFAVGDGNHSLAAAKACWESIKEGLKEEQRAAHPARFALAEIVNLRDDSLKFEPIHRVLAGAGARAAIDDFGAWLGERGMNLAAAPAGAMFVYADAAGQRPMRIERHKNALPLFTVQCFLDEWLQGRSGIEIDYVHGAAAAISLAAGNACAFLMTAIDKSALFECVRRDGALPRKTFSMGEANEKRYYLECRKINAG
jgi:hypothetical protein